MAFHFHLPPLVRSLFFPHFPGPPPIWTHKNVYTFNYWDTDRCRQATDELEAKSVTISKTTSLDRIEADGVCVTLKSISTGICYLQNLCGYLERYLLLAGHMPGHAAVQTGTQLASYKPFSKSLLPFLQLKLHSLIESPQPQVTPSWFCLLFHFSL